MIEEVNRWWPWSILYSSDKRINVTVYCEPFVKILAVGKYHCQPKVARTLCGRVNLISSAESEVHTSVASAYFLS
jgi:hypothetical protein